MPISSRNKALLNQNSFETSGKNFLDLFHQQVANNPDGVIVVAADKTISYKELDEKSEQISEYLKSIGVKSEKLVGLCSSLSADFIACMIGILKAGGVYFPLDPTYPRERLQYMLDDAKPCVTLVDPRFAHLFEDNKVVKIEEKIFSLDTPIESEKVAIKEENLAYLVYTSGSTGNPKGIMVTHKSLPNIALSHRDYYPPNMRMLISGGVCFDATLLVIFHALINHDPLYLFNYNPQEQTVDHLLQFIEENAINYMICIPSQYLRLLHKNRKLEHLKCVSLTGENLPKSLCNLHAMLAPNALLYNEYGPTEYAIGTTIAKIYDPKTKVIHQITVGNPLCNTKVYLLDQNLKEVAIGEKGEICIGGVGLARGYLNKKRLTAKKFVRVTMDEKPIRLYRTGDLGRFLPNGELEFLGRMEKDIHICGRQINLSEIEYHISHCPSILESIVMSQVNLQGKECVVAYVTSSKKGSARNALLKYLKDYLPKYMLPSQILEVDRFPLSPNGKIDREALVQQNV